MASGVGRDQMVPTGAHEARGFQVPNLERARRRSCADEFLGVAEPHALHRSCVTAETLQAGLEKEEGSRLDLAQDCGTNL